jgi:acetate kinase
MSELVLTLNGGSSSLKFAGYDRLSGKRVLSGAVEGLGTTETLFRGALEGADEERVALCLPDHRAALLHLLDWLGNHAGRHTIAAIGHRLVHGGSQHAQPVSIGSGAVALLKAVSAYAPAHLPAEIAVIEICRERFPDLLQVACFDTAFHRHMPAVARQLPIPRRLTQKGIERFGFHGLSYTFLVEELARQAGDVAAAGKLVLAHLGNGASLAAVRDRRSIDTTMGFSTSGGIPMATRSGELDPGLAFYLARTEGMSTDAFQKMVTAESGLLGMSESSGDIRTLLTLERTDRRAAEALQYYCYRIAQAVGAFAVSLSGIETLVFSGGVGEHAVEIRRRVCGRLGFLGVQLDDSANAENRAVISTSTSPVTVRVIATDEEAVICGIVRDMLAKHHTSNGDASHG